MDSTGSDGTEGRMSFLPRAGEKWRSRDPRDEGMIVTVRAVGNGHVYIQRLRKTKVKLARFRHDYEFVTRTR